MAKRDYSIQEEIIEEEKTSARTWNNEQPEPLSKEELEELAQSVQNEPAFLAELACAGYNRAMMLESPQRAKEIIAEIEQRFGYSFLECSSNQGIPDCICLGELVGEERYRNESHPWMSPEEVKENKDIKIRDILNCMPRSTPPKSPFSKVEEIEIPTRRQNLIGSCNEREEASIKLAVKLAGVSFPAFVTKSTLYMARFINTYRRNMQNHPYHLGEAYLLMEHGAAMQDAFTPEEVEEALETIGISGHVARLFMSVLCRKRDKRGLPLTISKPAQTFGKSRVEAMNPEAGRMNVPE